MKNVKKLLLIIAIVIVMLVYDFIVLDTLFGTKHGAMEYTYKEYTVSAGERLWDIAKNELENNEYYDGEDIRQIIYEIQNDNNINSNTTEGQVIKIRIKKDELSNTINHDN